MFLYTYIPVNPFNFPKNYGNHCTLLGNFPKAEGLREKMSKISRVI
jgi:hypothetical protein